MGMNPSRKGFNFASKMTKQKTDRKRDIMAAIAREDHPYYFLKNPEAILRYKYKGEDRSLIYKYALSPLAQHLVEVWTARTVAPNTITGVGLSFMVVSYFVAYYYDPSLTTPLPMWWFVIQSLCILVYQTLDNMDGKQARRTGSGTPLGFLFDHACDCVQILFGCTNWLQLLGMLHAEDITDSRRAWSTWLVLMPYSMMILAAWEHYWTGEMILPIINGPNEGLWLAVGLNLVTLWFGLEWWDEIAFRGISNREVSLYIATACCTQELISKMFVMTQRYGLKGPLSTLAPYLLLVTCWILSYDVVWYIPRTVLHWNAALAVDIATEIMMAHVTESKPAVWTFCNFQILLLVATGVLWRLGILHGTLRSAIMDLSLPTILSSITCTFVVTKLTILANEIAHVLNVWIFDIVSPRRLDPDDRKN